MADVTRQEENFRDEDAFPESGQISFLCGEIWVEMSEEQLFTHTDVKSEINTVLRALVKTTRAGRYLHDGAFVSNVEADISNQPNGVFVSAQSVREKRVQIIEDRHEGHVELEGSPDTVLEIISRSSVEKDTEVLRAAYAWAGVREYWLVDARGDPLRFDVLRLGRGGYSSIRKRAGWVRSDVFERWFRFRQATGEDGFPEFTLEVRNEKP